MTQTLPQAIDIQWRKPDELHPWEFSRTTFPALDPTAFAKLVADIRSRGVRVPVEVDPQGRIICGAERARACEALGQSVPTQVLRLGEELDYQEYAVRDNLHRRHLAPSDQARLVVIIQEIEQRRRRAPTGASAQASSVTSPPNSKVRDAVGAQVGLSGRQIAKYARLTRLPAPVQRLVDRRELSLEVAEVLATRGKGRPSEEIVELAKQAAEQHLSRTQVAKALRAPRRKTAPARADVPPLPPQKMSSLLMGLGAVVELEDVVPHAVVTACVKRAELVELGQLLGRAHGVVVRLRQAVDHALVRYNGEAS